MGSITPAQITTLHLRAEAAPIGTRGIISPDTARKLLEEGYQINIEHSNVRYFKDSEYEAVGCKLVPVDSWPDAPRNHIIIGMKGLPTGNFPLHHIHAHAAHCYRNQTGWKEVLMRFHRGGGLLLDLEFLTDDRGQRFVTFGREAGSMGAALGIKTWAHQLAHPDRRPLGPMPMYNSRDTLVEEAKRDLAAGIAIAGRAPRIMILGCKGNSGVGAAEFYQDIGIEDSLVTKWGRQETQGREDYPEILEHDILTNCVSLFHPVNPFVTQRSLETSGRKLTVISDISNDSHSPNNPLPIYHKAANTAEHPTVNIPTPEGTLPLTIAMIPYLPSLLPKEASESAANGLYVPLRLLNDWKNTREWKEVAKMYYEKVSELTGIKTKSC